MDNTQLGFVVANELSGLGVTDIPKEMDNFTMVKLVGESVFLDRYLKLLISEAEVLKRLNVSTIYLCNKHQLEDAKNMKRYDLVVNDKTYQVQFPSLDDIEHLLSYPSLSILHENFVGSQGFCTHCLHFNKIYKIYFWERENGYCYCEDSFYQDGYHLRKTIYKNTKEALIMNRKISSLVLPEDVKYYAYKNVGFRTITAPCYRTNNNINKQDLL